jgi:hypothetical protein
VRTPARLLLGGLLLPASLAGVHLLRPVWEPAVRQEEAPASPGWYSPSPCPSAEEIREEDNALEQHRRGLFGRLAEKRRLAAEVAAGRLGLPAAAARFRELDPDAPRRAAYNHPKDTPEAREEWLYRQVIAAVEDLLEQAPDRAAVVGRLEQELADHLRRLRNARPGGAGGGST